MRFGHLRSRTLDANSVVNFVDIIAIVLLCFIVVEHLHPPLIPS